MPPPAINPCTMRDEIDLAIQRIYTSGASVTFDGTSFNENNVLQLQQLRDYYHQQCNADDVGFKKSNTGYGHFVFGRAR